MPDEVLVASGDGLMVITLNRPEAKNAVDYATAVGVEAALDDFESDDQLGVAVITGAGGTFCAGMDLKAFARGERRPRTERRGFAGLTAAPPTKPLIAAVEGYALAGGFEIVLACDLVIAASDATFGLPEVQRGLCASAGGLFRLPDRIPYHQAMELALTGDFFDAQRASALGLLNRVVDPGQALTVATELAMKIIGNAPLAVQGAKRVIVESRGWPIEERFDRQAAITDVVLTSKDAQEGARAFTEKRKPVWRRA